MPKSIVVTQDKDKYKVLVCFVQRGIQFSTLELANKEAERIGKEEKINNILLLKEQKERANE